MKHIFKTSLSILLDQFMACILGGMFVPMMVVFFKNSLTGYLFVFLVCTGFFIYTAYLSAFKKGSHDHQRPLKKPEYKGYWYKGALAGAISAIPLAVLYALYKISRIRLSAVYFQVASMYWTWPLSRAFPNHLDAVLSLAFLPIVVAPWLGYIAGYKVFYITDLAMKIYHKFTEKSK